MIFLNGPFIKRLTALVDKTEDKPTKDLLVQCRFMASTLPKENERLQTLIDDLEREVKQLKDENLKLDQAVRNAKNSSHQ